VRTHYDFRIGTRTVGAFVIEDDGSEIRQRISFETDDGGRYENRYGVRYDGSRVLAYRVGDGDWVDTSALPVDHYPTAAYPLLIRHDVDAYVAIDEETGKLTPRTLERDGDRVIEREAETAVRSFQLRDDTIVAIDWGGATSTLTNRNP
jgi:hypothetical protein